MMGIKLTKNSKWQLKNTTSQNPLFFTFFFPALVDGVVTLLGQGKGYWTSSRAVNEASPAYYFLLTSPWLFIAGSVIWFIFWYFLIKKLKEPFNLFFSFLFITGHSWGSVSWIMRMLKNAGVYTVDNQPTIMLAWGIVIIYLSVVSIIATRFIKIYFVTNQKS